MVIHPDLPNELWSHAFSYLSKAELKSVRRCGSRRLGDLASQLLFTTAYVAARRGVLDVFMRLTTHDVFRDYVREVVFDSSYIDPEVLRKYEKDEYGYKLVHLFSEQERIQQKALLPRLTEAFQSMSAVTTVRYADLSKIYCLPGDIYEQPWIRDYQEGPLIRRVESGEIIRDAWLRFPATAMDFGWADDGCDSPVDSEGYRVIWPQTLC